MTNKKSDSFVQRQIIIIAIALLAFLFGLWFHHNSKIKNTTIVTATVLTQPRLITPFMLINNKGNPFTLESLKDHWNLVFFGFTNCPELCPTTLSVLNQTYKKLLAMHQNPMPQVLFISVDPERDTLARITSYLQSFNPSFVGATGTSSQLDILTKEFSVLYAKVVDPKATNPDDYMIDHSGAILIVNPQGQLYGVFSMPHDADRIAADVHVIMHTQSG